MKMPKRMFKRVPRPGGLGNIPIATRNRMAAAVHRAVCEVRGVDAPGGCQQYALAGFRLIGAVTGTIPAVQAGSLSICHSPVGDDGARDVVMIDARDGGYERGEVHLWLATEEILIDFSSRHFGTLVRMMGRRWEIPEPPPEFVWQPLKSVLPDLQYRADQASCQAAWDGCLEAVTHPWARRLGELAIRYYADAA